MTSLLAAITVGELAYQAYILGSQTFKYNEFFTSVAIAYFLMIFPVSLLARRLDEKGRRGLTEGRRIRPLFQKRMNSR